MALVGIGKFTFNGHSTTEYSMRMLASYDYNVPNRDIEVVEVPGRDGEVTIDNGRYKAVDWEVEFGVYSSDGDVDSLLNSISNWLAKSYKPQNVTFDNDPAYIYKAAVQDAVAFNRVNSRKATGKVKFRMHPYKYKVSGQTAVSVANGAVVNNNGSIVAKPLLRITGTGNGVVKLGMSSLTLKNVTGGVIVDSESETITTLDGAPAYAQMASYPFPTLAVGNNTITVPTGFTLQITPRTGVLV